MTVGAAPLLAAAAAVCGVAAAWTAVGALEHGLGQVLAAAGPQGALGRRLAPLLSGGESPMGEQRRLTLVAGLVGLAGGWLLFGPLGGALVVVAVPAGVRRIRGAARARRRERVAAAAPAVARTLADALGAGHAIRAAIAEAAAAGIGGPAQAELRRAHGQMALGDPTGAVLERWRARADHPAYDAIAAAILLQRESGGNLARLLRDMAAALEQHVRAEADARAMTAQARFTAMLVALLPLLAALLAELAHPGYLVSLVGRPLSAILVATSLALQLLAWVAVRRIARPAR